NLPRRERQHGPGVSAIVGGAGAMSNVCPTNTLYNPPAMAHFTKTAGGYFVSHNCTIVGDVTIGELCSFWFNAVVRGDVAPITIGRRTNVQDGAVIHCDTGVPNVIGEGVVIGHGAIVHGAQVGHRCLIGMGATLLSRTRL